MTRLCCLCVLALSLVACDYGPSEQSAAEAPAQTRPEPAPASAPIPQAEVRLPPVITPTAPAQAAVRYDGYKDLRFGMTAAEVKDAWDGSLKAAPDDRQTCFHLHPTGNTRTADLAFMIENDKFVRYSVGRGNASQIAPGGGKIGMSVEQIEKLYPDRVRKNPHKYVDGGKYLRIRGNDNSGGVLVFETDARGKVTEWRLGQPPQVDYVEGCS